MKSNNVAFLVALVIGGLSASAFADSPDSLDVSELAPGAALTFLQSLPLPTSGYEVIIGGNVYQTYPLLDQPQHQPICYFSPFDSANQNDIANPNLNAGISVAANSTFTLVSSTKVQALGDSQSSLLFKDAKGNRIDFECYMQETNIVYEYYTITIGDFKEALDGIANLIPSASQ